MAAPLEEISGLRAAVDRVEFNPNIPATDERPYAFEYHITIHNDSEFAVTIKGRKWVVTSLSTGHRMVYEAEGVLSKFPHLIPGQKFPYKSYHIVDSDSVAEGSYLGLMENGQRVLVRIPPFKMEVPPA
ncbi:MAG: ApaG domain [Candidatus Methylacidiphilales bacterium]|nr:ApaG domain [Candidatus Methylacidiphilales bacterium]